MFFCKYIRMENSKHLHYINKNIETKYLDMIFKGKE